MIGALLIVALGLTLSVGLTRVMIRIHRRPPSTGWRLWRRRIGIGMGWLAVGLLAFETADCLRILWIAPVVEGAWIMFFLMVWVGLLPAGAIAWVLMRLLKRPASMGWWRRIGIGMGWLTAGLLAVWVAEDLRSTRLLEKEIEKARAMGPLDWELPPMPLADENGCWELMRASDLMGARKQRLDQGKDAGMEERWFWQQGGFVPPSGSPWDLGKEDIQRARVALRSAADILALARQGADRPVIRFDRGSSPGRPLMEFRLPHLVAFRQAAQFLSAAARVEASDGNLDDALEDLLRVARIAQSLEKEQPMICGLVSVSIAKMACQGVDTVLAEAAPADPGRLARLIQALRPDPEIWHRMVCGERALDYDTARRFISGEMPLTSPSDGWLQRICCPPTWILRPGFRMDAALCLHYLDDLLETPPTSTLPSAPSPNQYHSPFGGLIIPCLDYSAHSFNQGRAQADALRWGLALRLAFRRSGRLPASLGEVPEEFLPDHPADPFTDHPFIYKPDADGKGFLLYSVGENRKDDGGIFQVAKGSPFTPDIGIHWKVAP